jgi:hypothetical protein
MSFANFDTSSVVYLRSSPETSPDAIFRTFSHDANHKGFYSFAAHGGLKPPPARRLRRAFLHFLYSTAFQLGLQQTSLSAFMAHNGPEALEPPIH